MKYEYISIDFYFGSLEYLNRLGSVGWHLVGMTPNKESQRYFALLERAVAA